MRTYRRYARYSTLTRSQASMKSSRIWAERLCRSRESSCAEPEEPRYLTVVLADACQIERALSYRVRVHEHMFVLAPDVHLGHQRRVVGEPVVAAPVVPVGAAGHLDIG